jgi:ABC-type transport system substrate-binding protein
LRRRSPDGRLLGRGSLREWLVRGTRSFVPIALVLLLAAACTGSSARTSASSRGPVGGTLRIGMENPASWGLDPVHEWSSATWELLGCCLVRTMMSYNLAGTSPDLRPIPDLAAAPPEISADGLTWTFDLRRGIHYAPPLADVEVTSGDFVRAIMRAAAAEDPEDPGLGGYLRMIEGIDDYERGRAASIVGLGTPDSSTLRITTTRLDSTLLYLLALPLTSPIPPEPGDGTAPFGVATGYDDRNAEPDGGATSYGPVLVASGPYMVEGAGDVDLTLPPAERQPPSGFTPADVGTHDSDVRLYPSITFVRNPSWRPQDDPLRPALADRIEIVGGPAHRLFRQMRAGDLDLVFDAEPPEKLLRTYQDDPALRPLVRSPIGSPGLLFAAFNVAKPPFDDVAVRIAVATAMDRAGLAEMVGGSSIRPAQHFAVDTFEASLLASWAAIAGAGGHGDVAAAAAAMRDSRYAHGGRCADPSCDGVPIVVREEMRPGIPVFRRALHALGIVPEIRIDDPYECTDPTADVAMCVGLGWAPDFPSASQYLGAFFAGDAIFNTSRLGASPAQLRRWGYTVTHVPTLDAEIDRCERELGSEQAPCWARLDEYIMTQLMPAVPMGLFATFRLSTPPIGAFPWNEVILEPALDRIAAPQR